MKAKNKSLGYILAMAIMFVVIAGSIGLATWAMIRTKLDVGGNISFTGTGDIEATISKGQLAKSNGMLSDVTGKMTGFDIASGYSESGNQATLDTWKNINISFDEDGLDIAICFKITNNSTTKNLKVTSPNATGSATNMTYVLTAMGRRADSIVIGHEEANKTVEFEIIFQVPDNNNNANMTFNVTLNLENTTDAATTHALTFRDSGDYYAVSAANTSIDGDIVIPLLYNDIQQSGSIDGLAFQDCSNIKSVIIPSSVTEIGGMAFNGCTSLSSVNIPLSVSNIGDSAFRGCSNLTEITTAAMYINDYAFEGCSKLVTITLLEGVGYIGTGTFMNCSSLTEISIPDGVSEVGDESFRGCSNLRTFVGNSTISLMGIAMFADCPKLESLTLPFIGLTNMTAEEDDAHYTQQEELQQPLESTLHILFTPAESLSPSDDYYWAEQVDVGTVFNFLLPKSLTSITLLDGCKIINYNAFNECSGLTSITIPSTVRSIGVSAFYGCSGLTSITIPSSVTSIGDYAFYDCSNLASVTFEDTAGWWVSTSSTATSGTNISSALSNTSTAATYLKDTYHNYYWKKG